MQTTLLSLLDQMENLIASAPALPVGGRIVISRSQLLDLIDAMHVEILGMEHVTRQAAAGSY